MGEDTAIGWTDHTFNPWWGCQRVSPGCEQCYAQTWDHRMGGDHWGPTAERRFFPDKHWAEPDRWHRAAVKAGVRRRVFCASMADVFEDRTDLVAPRGRLFDLIARTPMLDWLLLTKRPQNLQRMLPWAALPEGCDGSAPWPNVWVGTTVEDQRRAMERIPVLALVPAVVRFLSMEPLLERVTLAPYLFQTCRTCGGGTIRQDADGEACACTRYGKRPGYELTRAIDWVIAGCESGDTATMRPASSSWFEQLRDECEQAAVAYFLKQAKPEHGTAVYPGTGAHRPVVIGGGPGAKAKRDGVLHAPYLRGKNGAPARQHLAYPTPRAWVAAV